MKKHILKRWFAMVLAMCIVFGDVSVVFAQTSVSEKETVSIMQEMPVDMTQIRETMEVSDDEVPVEAVTEETIADEILVGTGTKASDTALSFGEDNSITIYPSVNYEYTIEWIVDEPGMYMFSYEDAGYNYITGISADVYNAEDIFVKSFWLSMEENDIYFVRMDEAGTYKLKICNTVFGDYNELDSYTLSVKKHSETITSMVVSEAPLNTEFYLEADSDYVVNMPHMATITFDDGSSYTVDMYNPIYTMFGIVPVIKNSEGETVEYDSMGALPVGSYKAVYSTRDGSVSYSLEFTVKSFLDITADFEEALPVSGNKDSGNQWFKWDVENTGTYEFDYEVSEYGYFTAAGVVIYKADGEIVKDLYLSAPKKVEIEEAGTYYVKVCTYRDEGSEPGETTYTVSMKWIPNLIEVEMGEVLGSNLFYYEIDSNYISALSHNVVLKFEDGTSIECTNQDADWNDWNINYTVMTENGIEAEYDENGKLAPGTYTVVYNMEDNITYSVEFNIANLADISSEFGVDKPITDSKYSDAYWVKWNVEDDGTYILTLNDFVGSYFYAYIWVYDSKGNQINYFTIYDNKSTNLAITTADTYYLKIEPQIYGDLEINPDALYGLSAEKKIEITSVEIAEMNGRTEFYQECDSFYLENMDYTVLITFDDGSTKTVNGNDVFWMDYFRRYTVVDSSGNEVNYMGILENGDYTVTYTFDEIPDISYSIDFSVKALSDISTEFGEDSPLTDAKGGIYYWVKWNIEKAGTYKFDITQSQDNYFYLSSFNLYDKAGNSVTQSWGEKLVIDENSLGEYYICIIMNVGEEGDSIDASYSLSVERQLALQSVELIEAPVRTVFYQELESYYLSNFYHKVKLTFEDGSVKEVGNYDNIWSELGREEIIYNDLGEQVVYECIDGRDGVLPVGNYTAIYNVGEYGEYGYSINFTVKSTEDIAEELTKNTAYENAKGKNAYWVKFMADESETYYFSFNTSVTDYFNSFYFIVYDMDGNVLADWTMGCENKADVYLEAGNYYIYFASSLKDSVEYDSESEYTFTAKGKPEVVSMEFNKMPEKTVFYYELEQSYLNFMVYDINLVFDDDKVVSLAGNSNMWADYRRTYTVYDENDEAVEYTGELPEGEYTVVYSIYNGLTYSIDFKVISLASTENKIGIDKPFKGLRETEEYQYIEWNVEKAGTYKLIFENQDSNDNIYNNTVIYDANGIMIPSNYVDNNTKAITFTQTGNYYIKTRVYDYQDNIVKVANLYVENMPDITAVKVVEITDKNEFVKELNSYYLDNMSGYLAEITFSDGTVKEVSPNDSVFTIYGRSYEIQNEAGELVNYDDYGQLPAGNYKAVYTVAGALEYEIPFTVVNASDMSCVLNDNNTELNTGSSYTFYAKVEISEPGIYYINKSGSYNYGYINVLDSEFNTVSNYNYSEVKLNVTEPMIYYIIVRDCRNGKVTFSRFVPVAEMNIISAPSRTEFYYGIENTYDISGVEFELVLEDGETVTVANNSPIWSEYRINVTLQTEDGNAAEKDTNGNYPIGNYKLVFGSLDSEATAEVPITIVGKENAATTRTGITELLTASGVYKLTIEEEGKYVLLGANESTSIKYELYNSNLNKLYSGTSIPDNMAYFDLGTGTFYIKVSDDSNVERKAFKFAVVADIESVTFDSDITSAYYAWGQYVQSAGNAQSSGNAEPVAPGTNLSSLDVSEFFSNSVLGCTQLLAKLTGEDEEVVVRYGYNTWNAYDGDLRLVNTDGSDVYADYRGYIAIGDYKLVASIGGKVAEIPFAITESEYIKDIRKANVNIPSQQYTGKEVTPDISLIYDGKNLAKDKDYFVEYKNNINLGTATAIITGNGMYSGTLTAEFKIDSLATPLISKVSSSNGTNTIKWNKVTGATGYIVYRKSGSTWKKIADVDGNTISYTDKASFTAGNTYTYTVKAYATVGDTTIYSNYSKTGKSVIATLATVTLKTPTSSEGKNTVKWNAVKGATGYVVYRKSGNSWKRIAEVEGQNVTKYTNKSTLSAGVTYTYTVKAYRTEADGTTSYGSYSKNGKSVKTSIATVGLKTPVSSEGQNTVKWNAVKGVTGYIVYRKSGSSWKKIADVKGENVTKYVDKSSSLKAGTSYTYTVKAYLTAGGKTSYGSYNKSGKSVKTSIATVSLKTPTSSGRKNTVKWNAVAGATGYIVYRKSGSTWKKIATVKGGTVTSYVDKSSSLKAGTKYTYTVKAYLTTGGKTTYGSYNKAGKSVTTKK